MQRLSMAWHGLALRHKVRTRRVTVPMWDFSARGDLITCECGRTWAL